MVQLVITAMKLQPCRPSYVVLGFDPKGIPADLTYNRFFDARDAILQADVALTGGENQCELWKGFSGRGLGSDATLKGSTPWGGGVRTDVSLPLYLFDLLFRDTH
jgi:extracellular elastinolytic metalloproteinase